MKYKTSEFILASGSKLDIYDILNENIGLSKLFLIILFLHIITLFMNLILTNRWKT